MNLYYLVWADCITKFKSDPEKRDNWKFWAFVMMLAAHSFNLMALMMLLSTFFDTSWYNISTHLSPIKKLDSLLKAAILFYLPSALLIYLVVFRKKRYEKIAIKYKTYNGKLFFWYFLGSGLLFIVPVIIGKLLSEFGLI